MSKCILAVLAINSTEELGIVITCLAVELFDRYYLRIDEIFENEGYLLDPVKSLDQMKTLFSSSDPEELYDQMKKYLTGNKLLDIRVIAASDPKDIKWMNQEIIYQLRSHVKADIIDGLIKLSQK